MMNRNILNPMLYTTPQEPIIGPGIYHNAQIGLLSASVDGENRITMADKNLGAVRVYNQGDERTEENCGTFFQRGNCYGFRFSGATETTTTRQDPTGYGPDNYYYSESFFIGDFNRETTYNWNLWGNSTNTDIARRGPCREGFHIPKIQDFSLWISALQSLGIATNDYAKYSLIPQSGYLVPSNGTRTGEGVGYYWTSSVTYFQSQNAIAYLFRPDRAISQSTGTAFGYSIRPFKNEPVEPDSTWTKLF